jgi:hypothetical protein
MTNAVVDVAKVVIDTATDYVVAPVGKALGLFPDATAGSPTSGAAGKPQSKAVRKAARKVAIAKAGANRAVTTSRQARTQ